MLRADERPHVEGELAARLATSMDLRAQLTVIFKASAPPLLQALPVALRAADEYAVYVVDYCLRSEWTQAPSMLELLLTWLVQSQLVGAFQPLLERVQQRIDPNPDLFTAKWVLADQPFVDRRHLRERARDLVKQDQRTVLRINGPAGRSYTAEFFEFLRDNSTVLRVVRAVVERGAAPLYQAKRLAETLASQMGVAERAPDPTGSSYASDLSNWILRHAMSQPGLWLLVLDGFGQRDLQPEVSQFVQELAQRITRGEHRKRMRLVLIDHTEPIPGVLGALILDETIPPAAAVTVNDLIECLVEHNARMQQRGRSTIEATGLQAIADRILQEAPSDGKERLQFIYDELFELTRMPA